MEQIEDARSDLDRDLAELEGRLRHEANLEVQFWKHPLFFVGGAVILGLLIFKLVHTR